MPFVRPEVFQYGDPVVLERLWERFSDQINQLPAEYPDVSRVTWELSCPGMSVIREQVVHIQTIHRTEATIEAATYKSTTEHIHLTTVMPVVMLPPDTPTLFVEKKIIPIFAHSRFSKSNHLTFTAMDPSYPNILSAKWHVIAYPTDSMRRLLDQSVGLLTQHTVILDEWNRWAQEPYEKIMNLIDIPLRF